MTTDKPDLPEPDFLGCYTPRAMRQLLAQQDATHKAAMVGSVMRQHARMFATNLRAGWIPADPADTRRLIEILETIGAPPIYNEDDIMKDKP